MSGHVFHPGHSELHGITVVLETNGALTYVGRYDSEDERSVHMLDVGVHDASTGTASREEYVRRCAKFGIRTDHKHLAVPAAQVVKITRLAAMA